MFDWSIVCSFNREEEHPLQSMFETCVRAHSNLDKLPIDAESAQSTLNCYTDLACHCARHVEALGLFSANEDEDDLSTVSLRYILASFLVAEGYADTRERLPRVRLRALNSAIKWYKDFLSLCERYSLIHPSAASSAQRIIHGEDTSDHHAARLDKIEQRRQERTITGKIDQILSAMRVSETADSPQDCVEESQRDLWSSRIHAASIKSVHAIEMVRQELAMLKMKAQESDHEDQEEQQENSENKLEHEKRKKEMRGTLMQIAKSLSSKQDQAKAVFKPSHILPTYSVEQAGLMELEQMRIREESEALCTLQEEQRKANLSKDEQEEGTVRQQRALDDWKDEHPTGYGNSKLRPCAL